MAMIRSAIPADAEKMAEVHVRAWHDAYTGLIPQDVIASLTTEHRTAMWNAALTSPAHQAWVAEVDGEMVGLSSVGPAQDREGWGQVYSIYVVGAVWGGGIGTALWHAAMDGLDEMGFDDRQLYVLDTNERARRFYERHGWHHDGTVMTDESFGAPIQNVRYVPAVD